ncbi:MAG: hypothetical protein ACK4GN_08680 [Runella sp.]
MPLNFHSFLFLVKNSVFLIGVMFALGSMAQSNDSLRTPEPLHASANINLTNNGVSLFPNLMLGRPATIINLTVGKKHIFFEPELRWGLDGKPWSYIFWVRYRSKKTKHFSWHAGVHPSYILRENQVIVNEQLTNRWVSQRFLAGEVVPVWHHSPKFSLGLHLLASKGLDAYGVQRSTYVSLQPRFPDIRLSKNYYVGFFPQVFHLALDENKGVYYSHLLTFNKRHFPVYFSTIFTYKIKSDIPSDRLLWNVGLNFKL